MSPISKLCMWVAILILTIAATGCSGTDNGQPAATAVTEYLEALVHKEENSMINLSCAEWENQAKLEFDSFAAVKVALEGPQCVESGQDGEIKLVSCSGKIIASYGEEDLILDLGDRTYQVVQEGGEWRMCGYR